MSTNLADMLSKQTTNGITKPILGGRTRKNRKTEKRVKWSKLSPGTHERTVMMKQCGKKCFLGPKKSFPICNRGTCKRNKRGVLAAYIRAREYMTINRIKKYTLIAKTAKRLLKQ
jgi:hypothetical protein